MFKVLLIENDKRRQEVISSFFKTEFSAETLLANCSTEGKDLLSYHPDLKLLIVKNKIEDDDASLAMLNFLYDSGLKVAFISLGEVDFTGIPFEELPDRFRISDLKSLVIQSLDITRDQLEEIHLPDYVPFPIHYFYQMHIAECDIFIKLQKGGKEQYIKRIHKGDEFDKEGILRYEEMGLADLYADKDDREAILDALFIQTMKKINETESSSVDFIEISSDSYNIVQDLISQLGIDEVSVQLAEKNISKVTERIDKNPSLAAHFKDLLQSKESYAYKNFYFLCVLSQGVVPLIDWAVGNKSHVDKMTYVAMFHDICLKDDFHIKIQSKAEIQMSKLEDDEKKLVNNHASDAASLVLQLKDAPIGLDTIIRQHHGMPNGIGFPEQYSGSISQHAIVLIVLEAFIKTILEPVDGKISIQSSLALLGEKFTLPSYKKVLDALKKYLIKSVKK
jgi:hypothetical protein